MNVNLLLVVSQEIKSGLLSNQDSVTCRPTWTLVASAGFHWTSVTPPQSIKTENHCSRLRERFSMSTVHKAVHGIFSW